MTQEREGEEEGGRKERRPETASTHKNKGGNANLLEFDDAKTLGHWLKYMAIENVKMEQVTEREEIRRRRRLEMDK